MPSLAELSRQMFVRACAEAGIEPTPEGYERWCRMCRRLESADDLSSLLAQINVSMAQWEAALVVMSARTESLGQAFQRLAKAFK